MYEHNLYPLRYNIALWEAVEQQYPGNGIIWARSAWAGSQRYALHWGGDAATTNTGMLGNLRGGLSFGLSGFSFWSHDMGGLSQPVLRISTAVGCPSASSHLIQELMASSY